MKRVTLLLTLCFLAACQNENGSLTGIPKPAEAPIQRSKVQVTADGLEIAAPDPRVDVLFVIDDSDSMKAHQENLSLNVGQFVDALSKTRNVDFHIGYTLIYDRSRYGAGHVVPPVCPADSDAPGRVNYYDPGTLVPLKGPNLPEGRRFVTNADDYKTILTESLDPKKDTTLIKNLINPKAGDTKTCAGGAEQEESFLPLLGTVENPGLSGNAGFRRPGAFFVAIILSDAKDGGVTAGEYTPEGVAARIARAVGQKNDGVKKFRVFSVAIKPGSTMDGSKNVNYKGESCEADPAFSKSSYALPNGIHYTWPVGTISENANPLATLARLTEDADHATDQVLSICDSNYGEALANFGNQVGQDILPNIEFIIPRTEVEHQSGKGLQILLGQQPLDPSLWYLDQASLRVVVYSQQIDWKKYAGQKIRAVFVPVNDASPWTKALK